MNLNLNTITIKAARPAMRVCAALILFALALPIWAHGGYDHVIGTIVKVDRNVVTVHTAKGDVAVKLNDQTEFIRAEQKAAIADLKPGARVIVDIPEGSKDRIAHSVKIGVNPGAH